MLEKVHVIEAVRSAVLVTAVQLALVARHVTQKDAKNPSLPHLQLHSRIRYAEIYAILHHQVSHATRDAANVVLATAVHLHARVNVFLNIACLKQALNPTSYAKILACRKRHASDAVERAVKVQTVMRLNVHRCASIDNAEIFGRLRLQSQASKIAPGHVLNRRAVHATASVSAAVTDEDFAREEFVFWHASTVVAVFWNQ